VADIPAVSPILDGYLAHVARTGETLYSWDLLRPLIQLKMDSVIEDFVQVSPIEEVPPYPNVDAFKFESLKKFLSSRLQSFQRFVKHLVFFHVSNWSTKYIFSPLPSFSSAGVRLSQFNAYANFSRNQRRITSGSTSFFELWRRTSWSSALLIAMANRQCLAMFLRNNCFSSCFS
jgi:hypothetical protein